jgi:hypothetical protein
VHNTIKLSIMAPTSNSNLSAINTRGQKRSANNVPNSQNLVKKNKAKDTTGSSFLDATGSSSFLSSKNLDLQKELIDELRASREERKEFFKKLSVELAEINTRVNRIETSQAILNSTVGRHSSEIEKINIALSKCNIIVHGLNEVADESQEALFFACKKLFHEYLGLDQFEFDFAKRKGEITPNASRDRPVQIFLRSYGDKLLVLSKRQILHEKRINIYINDDLPFDVRKRRSILRAEFGKARETGKSCKLSGDFLLIDDITYTVSNGQLAIARPEGSRRGQSSSMTRLNNQHTNATGARLNPGPYSSSRNTATSKLSNIGRDYIHSPHNPANQDTHGDF